MQDGGNFFIARSLSSKEIAGFIGVKRLTAAEGTIKRLAVLRAYRRQGVGTELVAAAVSWARVNGFTELRLSTGYNEHAKPIYEAIGFVATG
jgi:GNAT superfamily N-acetyltransferase